MLTVSTREKDKWQAKAEKLEALLDNTNAFTGGTPRTRWEIHKRGGGYVLTIERITFAVTARKHWELVTTFTTPSIYSAFDALQNWYQ